MSYTIRPIFITCLREINELSASEEPYALVTSVDLTTATPTFDVFLYGAFEEMDEGETRPINGQSFWGVPSSQPALITDRDNVIFIVTLMEQDNGSPRFFRALVKGVTTASLASTAGSPGRSAKVAVLLRDIRDSLNGLNLPIPFSMDDDHIGTEELRLNSSDLITSGSKTIPLIIRSREGFYRLHFQIDSLQPEATDCQRIRNEIAELTNLIRADEADLRQEGSDINRRRFLSNEIKRLTKERADKMNQLDQCLQRTSVASALTAVFKGTATVRTSHPLAPGPFKSPVFMSIGFNASRTTAGVTQFTPIVTNPFTTPLGQNVATISMLRGGVGAFDKQTGAIGAPITLNIDNSVDSPILVEDSTVEFMLTTGTIGNLTGAPLNSNSGAITLVGSSTLNGGILGGSNCAIEFAGSLAPIP